ncbi:MAG TPA: hypothetical protein PKD19_01910 [Candidatus Saccharibacteria bacterium]|nr:hypothetical protein [Candidatus Saccharibacteria bacterium]HMR38314.1 hypothetical protein [Candidatus Saccharibacteria bacterium]
MQSNKQILETFTIDSLPNLDTVVLGALEMLEARQVPQLDTGRYRRPLVVGSGNAEATGRIIFANSDAVFASESTVEAALRNIADIDGVVIVSASGGKHAPLIAKAAAAAGKPVSLITSNANSPAEQALSTDALQAFVFPKNREPYTYNTSTYMAMIQGYEQADIAAIRRFIAEHIDALELPDFSRFNKYYLIVPPQFSGIIRMLQVKFIELFGREVARDVETSEYVRHATTVVPSEDELFISFGEENTTWGQPENRLSVPLPSDAGYVAMMAVGYYIVGNIQAAKPQYFKQNIESYCQFISGVFDEEIGVIVEGNEER